MKRMFLFIPVFVLYLSCLGPYTVKSKYYDSLDDPFTTYTVKLYQDILFTINIQLLESEQGRSAYLECVFTGKSWLFISGEIRIKTDTNLYTLVDSDVHRMTLYGGGVSENASVILSKDMLNDMFHTSSIRVQIHGSPLDISEKGLLHYKRFYNENILRHLK